MCHATGGDVSGGEDENAFDYGDDFSFNSDDDVDVQNGGGGGGDGAKGTDGDGDGDDDDLDATLRMALMSTPSDVPTHRPSQCEP